MKRIWKWKTVENWSKIRSSFVLSSLHHLFVFFFALEKYGVFVFICLCIPNLKMFFIGFFFGTSNKNWTVFGSNLHTYFIFSSRSCGCCTNLYTIAISWFTLSSLYRIFVYICACLYIFFSLYVAHIVNLQIIYIILSSYAFVYF